MRTWRIAAVATLGTSAIFLALGCASGSRSGDQANDGPAPKPRPTPALNAQTYFAHGHLLERQGNFEGAAQQYRNALELNPNLIAARNRLGITLNKLGKNADAVVVFRDAVRQWPDLAHLQNNLGFSLLLNGSYADAESATRKALDIRPDFRRARMNHGIVLAKLGRFDEAYGEFKSVCTRDDAMYNLAMVKADAGQYADAISILREALALNPAFEPAQKEIERLASLHQNAPTVVASNITTPDRPTAPAPVAAQKLEAKPVPSAAVVDSTVKVADVAPPTATPGAAKPTAEPIQTPPPEPIQSSEVEETPVAEEETTEPDVTVAETEPQIKEEIKPAQPAPATDSGVIIKDVTPANSTPVVPPPTPSPAPAQPVPAPVEEEDEDVDTAKAAVAPCETATAAVTRRDDAHVDAFEVAALATQLRWGDVETLDESRLDQAELAAFTTFETTTPLAMTVADRSAGIDSIMRLVSRILSYFGLVPWLGVEMPAVTDESDAGTIQVLASDDADAFLRRSLGFQLDLIDPARVGAVRPVIE